MKARLLSTVAASLIIGMSPALAQYSQQQMPERAPGAQQSAPAEKSAPPMRGGERKAPETSGQATPESKGGANKEMKGSDTNKAPETRGQAPSGQAPKGTTQPETRGQAPAGTEQQKPGMKGDTTSPSTRSTTEGTKSQDNVQGTQREQSGTTGQGAAGAAKLSTEQRTKITTVIRDQKVERIEPSKLNISIRVGERVPSHVRFYPLPTEVVTIYPEWRGYLYILVGDEILVVHPRTHEIVAVLEA